MPGVSQHRDGTQGGGGGVRSRSGPIPTPGRIHPAGPSVLPGRARRKRSQRLCFCFGGLQPATQSLLSAAASFHSDWTNWELLTANPIRAGTGQSRPAVCHPWHTRLPPPSIKAFVRVTSRTFAAILFFFFPQSCGKSLMTFLKTERDAGEKHEKAPWGIFFFCLFLPY